MHWGYDVSALRLCNSCLLRENTRTKKPKENNMDEVKIVITMPRKLQMQIEEFCINQGIDFSKFFIDRCGLAEEANNENAIIDEEDQDSARTVKGPYKKKPK
jgi:hypothetical protein